MDVCMIHATPSLLLSLRAAFFAPVAAARWLPLLAFAPLVRRSSSSSAAAVSTALLVDDGHVVGEVADVVVRLARRNLAVDLRGEKIDS